VVRAALERKGAVVTCANCGRPQSYVFGKGCAACGFLDDEEQRRITSPPAPAAPEMTCYTDPDFLIPLEDELTVLMEEYNQLLHDPVERAREAMLIAVRHLRPDLLTEEPS
jgi:hypothetical protein